MYRVVKRDGRIVDFEISKIANAMKKAFDATETNYNQSVIDFLAVMVTADFQPKITDELIHVEDIQDSVESRALPRRLRERCQGVHPLPQAAREAARREATRCSTIRRPWITISRSTTGA